MYTLRLLHLKHIMTAYEILGGVTNNPLEQDSEAWIQATLSVKLGCLGIRRAFDVAPSAYLASIYSSSELVDDLLFHHNRYRGSKVVLVSGS